MPFGLKNVDATYHCLVNIMFKGQSRRNIGAHVNDMMTKTVQPKDHVKDLEEVFSIIWKYGLRLNPKSVSLVLPQKNSWDILSLPKELRKI